MISILQSQWFSDFFNLKKKTKTKTKQNKSKYLELRKQTFW